MQRFLMELGTLMYCFQNKLKKFKQHLKDWNKNVFGNIFQAQKSLEKCMEEIQVQLITEGSTKSLQAEEQRLKHLDERYAQEEILWRQKSRVQWLKEGERN